MKKLLYLLPSKIIYLSLLTSCTSFSGHVDYHSPPHRPVPHPVHPQPVPPPRPNVKGPHYRWDESRNPMGPHRCSSSMQCSGERTCSQHGWCQDVVRPVRPLPPGGVPAPRPAPKPQPAPAPNQPGWGPPPSPSKPVPPGGVPAPEPHQPGWGPPQ